MTSENNDTQLNNQKRRITLLASLLAIGLIVLLAWRLISNLDSQPQTEPYLESFESVGEWTAGEGANSEGVIVDGAYQMSVEVSGDIFWATAGQNFADGRFEVEATPLEGVADNGYGMLFRIDNDGNNFYVFKVSSDGYVFAGLCSERCLEQQALLETDWFASPAVHPGMGVTNVLRVEISGPEMIFYVNDEEVGRTTDDSLDKGDIGLLTETFAPGGLQVAFDNFSVQPQSSEQ
jgi:hypothetical protein